jgi:ABC-type multidrug transport system permease subunit
MMKHASPWTRVILLSALAAAFLSLVANDMQVRVVVVLWFFLVCPGMMLVRYFRLGDPVLEWVLAIALSFVADAFVAGILLYARRWTPTGAFVILLVLTVAGTLTFDLTTRRAERRTLC